MTWAQLCELGTKLPGVTVETWYRTPALKVGTKGFVRLKEDGKTVVFVVRDLDERDALLDARPELFFITDHYQGYPAVLALLSKLKKPDALERLEAGRQAQHKPKNKRT